MKKSWLTTLVSVGLLRAFLQGLAYGTITGRHLVIGAGLLVVAFCLSKALLSWPTGGGQR